MSREGHQARRRGYDEWKYIETLHQSIRFDVQKYD